MDAMDALNIYTGCTGGTGCTGESLSIILIIIAGNQHPCPHAIATGEIMPQ
jgi:hypothetical protein